MIKNIYGVNIAVNDLSSSVDIYEKFFGIKSTALPEDHFAFPGLLGASLDINGFRINLITSTGTETSVANFLRNRGEGLFLLSVEVDSIDSDSQALRAKGFPLVMDATLKGSFGAVNFVHPKSMKGVQIELYQPGEDIPGR